MMTFQGRVVSCQAHESSIWNRGIFWSCISPRRTVPHVTCSLYEIPAEFVEILRKSSEQQCSWHCQLNRILLYRRSTTWHTRPMKAGGPHASLSGHRRCCRDTRTSRISSPLKAARPTQLRKLAERSRFLDSPAGGIKARKSKMRAISSDRLCTLSTRRLTLPDRTPAAASPTAIVRVRTAAVATGLLTPPPGRSACCLSPRMRHDLRVSRPAACGAGPPRQRRVMALGGAGRHVRLSFLDAPSSTHLLPRHRSCRVATPQVPCATVTTSFPRPVIRTYCISSQ